MARLWSSGFENNTTGSEFTSTAGAVSIQTSVVRSGTYALRASSLSSATIQHVTLQYVNTEVVGNYYFRFYVRFATFPSAQNQFINFNDTSTTTPGVYVTIDGSGVLRLFDEDGQITGTTTLSVDTWYRLEVHYDTTGAGGTHTVEARIDGVNFATATNRNIVSTNQPVFFRMGANLISEAQTTGDWFFDDVAVNDTTGSSQTSWPGEGKIIHLRPVSSGDNAADLGTFADIDEVTPNDATDFIDLDTGTSIGDYRVTDPVGVGILSNSTINVLQVGFRAREEASAAVGFAVRLKSASGGTTTQTSFTDLNTTLWISNYDPATPSVLNYRLTSYLDPTTSLAWTVTGTNSLSNAQIGAASNTTNDVDVTALWLLVDYSPGVPVSSLTGLASITGLSSITM